MDALALLCTLHADGPATLKRLRARGWTSLGSLLTSDADELADGLGIGAPAARRLLREARMLSGRVGLEVLDEEEAPPTSIAQPGGALRPDLAELGARADESTAGAASGGLDSVDHALVSRIVGSAEDSRAEDGTDVAAEAEVELIPFEPAQLAETPAPAAVVPDAVELDLVEQFRPPAERELAAGADAGVTADELDAIAAAPAADAPVASALGDTAPESMLEDDAPVDESSAVEDPVSEDPAVEDPAVEDRIGEDPIEVDPVEETPMEATPVEGAEDGAAPVGALRPGLLPGLDEALVQDLRAEGISTLDDLAQAKSLLLTRSLGITFAQARRLQFLARREAKSVTAAMGAAAASLGTAVTRVAVEGSSAAVTKRLSGDVTPEPEAEPQPEPEPEIAASVPVASTPVVPEVLEEDVEPFEFAPAPEHTEVPTQDAAENAVEHEPVVEIFPSPPPAPEALSASEPESPESESRPSESLPSEPLPSAAQEQEQVAVEAAAVTPSEVDGPAAEPARADDEPVPAERRPFWESRILDEARETDGDASDGERVDPAEIAPPPRFGERFARAAAEGRLRRSRSASGRTVLGWNFEIPRPSAENLPYASLGNPAPPAEGPGAEKARETADAASADAAGSDTSGPFA